MIFRFDRVMFLVMSDDLKWCKENLNKLSKNVVVVYEIATVMEDLALLASGKHVIISIGTFGFWGAMLAGGEIAFPASRISTKYYYVLGNLLTLGNVNRLVRIYWK